MRQGQRILVDKDKVRNLVDQDEARNSVDEV